MDRSDFIKSVKSRVNITHFDEYVGKLATIPAEYRQRFLFTLDCCSNPSTAYELLYKGRLLPEENYKRFLQFMSPRLQYA